MNDDISLSVKKAADAHTNMHTLTRTHEHVAHAHTHARTQHAPAHTPNAPHTPNARTKKHTHLTTRRVTPYQSPFI